jgi:hypothetical protein
VLISTFQESVFGFGHQSSVVAMKVVAHLTILSELLALLALSTCQVSNENLLAL